MRCLSICLCTRPGGQEIGERGVCRTEENLSFGRVDGRKLCHQSSLIVIEWLAGHQIRIIIFRSSLNDAQWTTAGGRYPIGLRSSRDYFFVDLNALYDVVTAPDADGAKVPPFWVVRVRRLSQR